MRQNISCWKAKNLESLGAKKVLKSRFNVVQKLSLMIRFKVQIVVYPLIFKQMPRTAF